MNGFLFDIANFAIGAAASSMILATPYVVTKIRYGKNGKPLEELRYKAVQDFVEKKDKVNTTFSKREETLAEINDAFKKAFPSSDKRFTLQDIYLSDSNLKDFINFLDQGIENLSGAKKLNELSKFYDTSKSNWMYRKVGENKIYEQANSVLSRIEESAKSWATTAATIKRLDERITKAKENAADVYERFYSLYFEALPPLVNSMDSALDELNDNQWNLRGKPYYLESIWNFENSRDKEVERLIRYISKVETEIENLNAYENSIFPHTKKLRNIIKTATSTGKYTIEGREKLKEKALSSIVLAEMSTYQNGNPRKQYGEIIKPAIEFVELFCSSSMPVIP